MDLKKIFFIIVCCYTIFIQAQTYNFTTTTGTYTNLVNSTSLNDGAPWDDPEYTIPIGFNFQYFNTTITEIHIGDWGFGAELSTTANATGTVPTLTPYGADIIDRAYDFSNINATTGALSRISYALEGISGSRILKIEWNNVGFHSEIENNDTSTNFTNFQLWLFEGSNNIEMHYGPNSITDIDLVFDGETGTSVSLMPAFNVDTEVITQSATFLTGIPNAPSAISSTLFDTIFLNGIIPNGTIYRFTKSALSVNDFELAKVKLTPNPTNQYFNISNTDKSLNIESISILSTNGSIIKEIQNPKDTIDVSSLTSGMYLVKIKTESSSFIKKLIKSN